MNLAQYRGVWRGGGQPMLSWSSVLFQCFSVRCVFAVGGLGCEFYVFPLVGGCRSSCEVTLVIG